MNAQRILSYGVCALLVAASASLWAAPGSPIGGIIVKGGKNPGGQMLVKATTDAGGKFTIHFPEGGEYRLVFEHGPASRALGDITKTGAQLEYSVSVPGSAARHTPFHNKIEGGSTVISVPSGGGVVSAVLSSAGTSSTNEPAPRAIDEPGVSVKTDPQKGSVKK